MKPRISSVLIVISAFLCACGNQKSTGNRGPSDSSGMHAGNAKAAIPFLQAKNYFVRNDYKDTALHLLKLDSREAFERVFGMATTMSPDGKPTPINFDTDYALACISETSDKPIELQSVSLTSTHGNILLTCSRKEGPAQTFISRSALILIVDKHTQGAPVLQLR